MDGSVEVLCWMGKEEMQQWKRRWIGFSKVEEEKGLRGIGAWRGENRREKSLEEEEIRQDGTEDKTCRGGYRTG